MKEYTNGILLFKGEYINRNRNGKGKNNLFFKRFS